MATITEMLTAAVKLHQGGNLADAEKIYYQILQVNPQEPEALHLLGVLAHQVGKEDVAVDYIERALQLRPNFAEAYHNLAIVYQALGRMDNAEASDRQALLLKPDFAEALNSLGVIAKKQGKLHEAMTCYQKALQSNPNLADAHNNLGNLLQEQDDFEAALDCYQKALSLKSNYMEVFNNIGNTLQKQGKLTEAIDFYRQALSRNPNFGDAHWHLALAFLVQGDFAQGWREYEWRWKSKGFQERNISQPLWDGSSLTGRTILLHAEQGLGDTIHFIRYARLVKARGGRVIVACQKPLLRLLAGCQGIDYLVAGKEQVPPFDVHAPLLSLPGIFGTNLTNIPAEIPYLEAKPHLVEQWRKELTSIAGFKIGIAWQGGLAYRADRQRSIPLTQFAPLARVPGVRLLSLQKGYGSEQISELAGRFEVIDLGSRLDETNGPFMDTAAVMKNLDLVITCDTVMGHLAGALGVPVWTALPFMPDWRWMLERTDSPWYPSVRLFRQSRSGNWEDVFERMASALGEKLHAAPKSSGVEVAIAPGELIDKITILEIKSARITDAQKLRNIQTELTLLLAARGCSLAASAKLTTLTADLKSVNEQLWDIEDEIRVCERQGDFGARFIELARSVYKTNDRRAALKRSINDLFGSSIVEEKSYAKYH